ncbi:hypothetical protein E8E15_002725 [Penicillium rubens]|uniref:Pc22g22000 protein n=2 Tax=Penicillium chrysogenum species complex TaxID=254878 RepID=B6HTC6_PENRW|nr:uncharacterized protein N7525_004182 [Penicillium rubens]KZN90498.1 hypothetical protein EN45_006150 [Penicillium chrysogenum]CAP99488.1 Pc22g22000 [Penicillium rubens Wisconsin 54-1255]KAF3013129.1 hypothetical protein E8E15_002725 [Penicillium rubens]KAJ5045019.1 hypothetical protein NUH16_001831 [Penicillium rubens]KAJ5838994.1 hypothetical protein N7525_004182 [Penicillium rubens]
MAPSSSRSRSTRPMRSSRTKVQTYHEESSSQDESRVMSGSRRASLSLRSRSTTRMPKSYREDSTDASFDGAVEDEESDALVDAPIDAPSPDAPNPDPKSVTTRTSKPKPPRRAATTPKPKQTKRSKPNQIGSALQKRAKTHVDDPIFLGSGVIPPWQTLPYQILLDIFLRASHPLLDESRSTRNDSVKWLVNVALLCRSFHEPALAALYHCPPLLPAPRSHVLLSLLERPQESLSMNYSSKIKQLHVEVEPILVYKSGPGYFDLAQLIEKTPRLHTVRLYHKDDYTVGIPQWQIAQSKWTYPDALFSAIENRGITLRSWEWNSRFLETDELVEMMVRMHSRRAFQGLKELKLLRFDNSDEETSAAKEAGLLEALDMLPELQRLEFIESSLVSGEILINLPNTLHSLTLNNCDRLWSSDLTAYLSLHGTNLRELSLSHNRHLNMSFIQNLAHCCENLEVFKMDLSMHDASSYRDVEPHFEALLVQTEVPTWPVKLREIELTQLRKWDDATAEVFFTSLVNAAPKLHDLRRLTISAILKIGWRDRANFRERWIGLLEKVFLRRSMPPDPNLRSLQKRSLKPTTSPTRNDPDEPDAGSSTRPSTADSGPSTSSKRQSTRLARQRTHETDDAASDSSLMGTPQSEAGKVQGMCDIVNIRIDNQRPTEFQLTEEDFLDDELSGDEDWAGE